MFFLILGGHLKSPSNVRELCLILSVKIMQCYRHLVLVCFFLKLISFDIFPLTLDWDIKYHYLILGKKSMAFLINDDYLMLDNCYYV